MKTVDAAAPAAWIRLAAAVSMAIAIGGCWSSNQPVSGVAPRAEAPALPAENFTRPPQNPHDPAALYFTFDQLDHYYRVPGEFTHRLTGDQYGFETMSFIITETHPGGGPGLHVHDVEEAHVLLQGRAEYRVGDSTFFVDGPYIAKVPAGVPHTFINAGPGPFNLVAVFASKHPGTKRLGPNPLIGGTARMRVHSKEADAERQLFRDADVCSIRSDDAVLESLIRNALTSAALPPRSKMLQLAGFAVDQGAAASRRHAREAGVRSKVDRGAGVQIGPGRRTALPPASTSGERKAHSTFGEPQSPSRRWPSLPSQLKQPAWQVPLGPPGPMEQEPPPIQSQ